MILLTSEELKNWRAQVHVAGWEKGATFQYVSTDATGQHTLRTPRTGRIVKTRQPLVRTNRYKNP